MEREKKLQGTRKREKDKQNAMVVSFMPVWGGYCWSPWEERFLLVYECSVVLKQGFRLSFC